MTGVLGLSLFVTIGPLFLILSYLIYEGLGSINWDFFVRLPKPPGEPGGGLANALVGSAMLVGIATIGVDWGADGTIDRTYTFQVSTLETSAG